ncbi:UDP-N-acetylmuramoyl-tripeptide--D-alanyl-D-alanine ligase [Clostridium aciditolerans]|uniref:UDP-N-acetylmuramoyl-tripeptide--D-alanyl-D-alanine ligase n=1 Tax=Clostridium aciditolerans TaxID=339861 RepID=A0A934M1B5_9CLOT|nr:UDP-N-acetylmuramoyl-tripeptide--D-alanyl-D-alanine ligase [Clostridium aciditolerans]MBI6873089.1 UDP-N-acetylmuramoyl-tripeptide--D-alanyl-D-alanine ligase [Clostridium aciditolerans]
MEYMSFDEIVSAVQGEVVLKGEYSGFNAVSTDTRKIEKGNIFVALKGENFNGNEYIKTASEKGAAICIVDEIRYKDEEIKNYTTVIKVQSTGSALLDLAEAYRSKLNLKVVGITGSAGKTSTKDLVAAALSGKYKVFKTAGNFNNQIGLPLMIFKLDNSYDIAVLEMGMNNLKEIHTMAKAARPDVALITNVGTAHIGKLGSRENILKAKLEITDFFNSKNILIINGDNDMLSSVENSNYQVIKTGIDSNADFKADNIELGEDYVEFEVIEGKGCTKEKFHIDMPGKHTISNALLAIGCSKIMNMDYENIRQGLKNIQTTSMRMDIIKGEKFSIINDCYNANPDSMKVAIDVLKNSNAQRKVAVLGTMGELGEEAFNSHKDVGEYAGKNNVDLLITIGEYSKAYEEGFSEVQDNRQQHRAFENYDDAVDFLTKEYLQEGDTVLIKASRAAKFELIVEKLKKNIS